MPNLDGTGPNGQGPRTGRGLGNCPGSGGAFKNTGRGLKKGLGLRRSNQFCPGCPYCPYYQQDVDQPQTETDNKDNKNKKDKE